MLYTMLYTLVYTILYTVLYAILYTILNTILYNILCTIIQGVAKWLPSSISLYNSNNFEHIFKTNASRYFSIQIWQNITKFEILRKKFAFHTSRSPGTCARALGRISLYFDTDGTYRALKTLLEALCNFPVNFQLSILIKKKSKKSAIF